MLYVGLDVHAKQSTFAFLGSKDEKPRTMTVRGSLKTIMDVLEQINEPFEMAFEASNGYGPLYDLAARKAQRVVVAHPGKLRLIYRSKHKNNSADAKALAQLLRAGYLPEVYVPKPELRAWRRLIQHRSRLVGQRTRVKCAVRALLRGVGVEMPKGLWTKAGLAWLRELALESRGDALMLEDHLVHLDYLNRSIRRAERELDRIGRNHPSVALLRTIPGIGPRTAEAMVAWVGDPRRFARIKAVGNYFGLVPREDSSGDRRRLGHITQEGPAVVRRLLNQAALQAIRRSPEIRARYERVRRDDPDRHKIAIVATMDYLARVMVTMLRGGETWNPEGHGLHAPSPEAEN
jgi:transposase